MYPSYELWKCICNSAIEGVFKKVCIFLIDNLLTCKACAVLPPRVSETLTLEEAKHYCSAALIAGFRLRIDAGTYPPPEAFVRVDVGFLGDYMPTADRLAQYGMGIITGSVSAKATEGELLARAGRWAAAHPGPLPPNPLLSGPLPEPVYPPLGPIPDTNLEWVSLSRARHPRR